MSRGVDTGCPTRYSREYRGYWKYSRQVCAWLIIPLATSIRSSCSLCEYVCERLAMCHAPSPRKYVGFVEGGRNGSGFFDLFYRGIAPHLHIASHRGLFYYIDLPFAFSLAASRKFSLERRR